MKKEEIRKEEIRKAGVHIIKYLENKKFSNEEIKLLLESSWGYFLIKQEEMSR